MDLMKDFDHRRGAGHIKDPEREIWQGVMVKVTNGAAGRRREDCADGRQMEEQDPAGLHQHLDGLRGGVPLLTISG